MATSAADQDVRGRTLPADRTAPAAARHLLEELTNGELDEGTFADAQLVLSELVTNAVEYGVGESIRVDITRCAPAAVELRVRNRVDGDGPRVPPRPWTMPGAPALRGRGLAVVQSLASWTSVTSENDWLELRARVTPS